MAKHLVTVALVLCLVCLGWGSSGSSGSSDSSDSSGSSGSSSSRSEPRDPVKVARVMESTRSFMDWRRERNKHFFQKGFDGDNGRHQPFHFLTVFNQPDTRVKAKVSKGIFFFRSLKELTHIDNKRITEMEAEAEGSADIKDLVQEVCDRETPLQPCDPNARYRSANGSCTNPTNPAWGMATRTQRRFLKADYDDDFDLPRQTAKDGSKLTSARVISNVVHKSWKSDIILDRTTSSMFGQYGQFIVHDIIHTPVMTGEGGVSVDCCETDENRPECFPIAMSALDPYFNVTCMDMQRSAPAASEDCDDVTRQQINQETSALDGSVIYGSSLAKQKFLRTFQDGKLKSGPHNLLPCRSGGCKRRHIGTCCQASGDVRVNVIPGLGVVHTLFHREHNRIVGKLKAVMPMSDDETLFQEARRIVAAQLQHITYNEYLPLVIGKTNMDKFGLWSTPRGFNNVFNPNVDPTVRNGFGAAASRFQHSSIPRIQGLKDHTSSFHKDVPLETTFFNPYLVQMNEGKGLDCITRWLLSSHAPSADRIFEEAVRSRLFVDDNGDSMDLCAINIQRGRDHGLPSYNKWREWCHLPKVKHFGTSYGGLVNHDYKTAQLLSLVYRDTDDIDLFSGGVSERHVEGGAVGPTFACIIGLQYKLLKTGDKFWYENGGMRSSFTEAQVNEIKKTTMAKVICDNSAVKKVQKFSMKAVSFSNPVKKCTDLPGIDLSMWMANGD